MGSVPTMEEDVAVVLVSSLFGLKKKRFNFKSMDSVDETAIIMKYR